VADVATIRTRETILLVAVSFIAGAALLPVFAATKQPIVWKGLVAAVAAASGSIVSASVWSGAGRPALERLWIEKPWVALAMMVSFGLGISPAAVWIH